MTKRERIQRGLSSPSGFTLIELLVVIAIIAILAAILFPVFAKARQTALKAGCQSNLNQIGKAVMMYTQDNEETYPTNKLASNAPLPAMRVFLPTIPPAANYTQLPFVVGLDKYIKNSGTKDTVTVWKCPAVGQQYAPSANGSVPGFGDSRITYAMNFGICEETDGTAKFPASTMMFRELGINDQSFCCAWTTEQVSPPNGRPQNIFLTNPHSTFGGRANLKIHGGQSNIVFLDGHVQSFPNETLMDTNVVNNNPQRPGYWVCQNASGSPVVWITP
ncbi:MAG: prepilin-type N-terminal cleavage/methylation domain-containing protein [Armatimonadetes bacterium]|nr:prepilin-type N-terminal cleavage/methylation domain-containing protein [Armatimonadota bacterium]